MTTADRALKLYKPPFRFDRDSGQICDVRASIVFSFVREELGRTIAEALTEYWEKYALLQTSWHIEEIGPTTRCKHGKGACAKCGTTDRRDAIHEARTPNKRAVRRARKKAKR